MTTSTKTVLVTGGTGFIAGWCIVELLRQGYRVRTTVRNLSREPASRTAIRDAVEADRYSEERLSFLVADLMNDTGWEMAMTGCDYVLHVASPLASGEAGPPEAIIAPARDGTLRVLKAAARAGVQRVVMTSAAATARPPLTTDKVSDETIWADPADPQFDTYRVSKILAERAAWDFMAGQPAGGTTFTTILPSAVFGPVLTKENLGSVRIIHGLLHGRPPGIPKIGLWIVDVRDLAALHVTAMIAPKAAGQRFIAAGDFMWMAEIAKTLRAHLDAAGEKVPSRPFPDFLVRALAVFSPNMRMLTPILGRKFLLTSEKARRVLGFSPRPAITTIIECAESLLDTHRGSDFTQA